MEEFNQARKVLGNDSIRNDQLIALRPGARSRAVIAALGEAPHRFAEIHSQVVVKLYKGDGKSPGSKAYQRFHQHDFHQLSALAKNTHIQQSLTGGVMPNVGPYAVTEFVEGEELANVLECAVLTKSSVATVLEDILFQIWIPLWTAGLRFKDCHPGNFVLTPTARVVMIDTEQMRKDAHELLVSPGTWTERNKHETAGLKRLPRLVQRIVLASNPPMAQATLLRNIKEWITDTALYTQLHKLGRYSDQIAAAELAARQFLIHLRTQELIP